MRRLVKLVSMLSVASLFLAPTALAGHGSSSPNGSHEDQATGEVTCGEGGNDVGPLGKLYVNERGVEFCSDDDQGVVPGDHAADGRIIVTDDQGGYVAADGDPSNSEETDGWIRLDGDGFKACSTSGDPEPEDNTGDSTAESCEAEVTTVP